MSRVSILLFCIITLISCTTNKSNKKALDQKGVQQDIINNIDSTQTTDTISKPEVLIKYKSPVNGYNVSVEWLGAEIIDDDLAFGDVLIHFKKNDGTGYTQVQ